MCDCKNGCGSTGFFRWLLVIQYYGFCSCRQSGKKVYISKTARRKLYGNFLLFAGVFAISLFLAEQFKIGYLGLVGILIGFVLFLILSYRLWKSAWYDSNS